MATCAVLINIQDASETAIENVTVRAYPPFSLADTTNDTLIVPYRLSGVTDAGGDVTLNLQQGLTSVVVEILLPDGRQGEVLKSYLIDVPNTANANFEDLI